MWCVKCWKMSTPDVVDRGVLVSVNVGRPRPVPYRGHQIPTAIWKEPVEGPVAVRGVNLAGDIQADLSVHGGPDKAVYAYSLEDLTWWSEELGRDMPPAIFGENLTVSGIPVSGAVVGELWQIGAVLLEVCQPRLPCFKLGIRMGSPHFLKRFTAANRPGAYLRIKREGVLQVGDAVVVQHRPAHGITVALMAYARERDHHVAQRLLAAEEMPSEWREWAVVVSNRMQE
jgi:MOSC domain-containing protein YiiM